MTAEPAPSQGRLCCPGTACWNYKIVFDKDLCVCGPVDGAVGSDTFCNTNGYACSSVGTRDDPCQRDGEFYTCYDTVLLPCITNCPDRDFDDVQDVNCGGDDCNDDPDKNGAAQTPGKPEICNDGIDNNCREGTDWDDRECRHCASYFEDCQRLLSFGYTWDAAKCDCDPPDTGGCTVCPTWGEERATNPGWCDIEASPSCSDGCDNDRDRYCDANDEQCICPSPVVIDTLGDGFDFTDAAGGVEFDIDGNGTKGKLSWTAAWSDDAWLALDRDANGRVDDGAELFGNYTEQPPSARPHGFLALAEFDHPANGGNGDGVIDNKDAVYASLRLWQDRNHNGLSEAAELHPLPSLGVASISLDYKEARKKDRHGNGFRYRAKINEKVKSDAGKWAWDVFLIPEP